MNSVVGAMLEWQQAAQVESFRAWRRWLNVAKIPMIASEAEIATTPHDVVYDEDSLKLLHYHNEHSIDFAEPVVICFALVNRPYILDLQPSRSVVRQLLKRGFDVYLIDWGIPTAADRTLRLQDYVCGFMKNVAEFVRTHGDSPKLNLLGYCMGGTMSAMYTALYPEQTSFQMMRPVHNYVEKYMAFAEEMDDDSFLEIDFAIERWVNDNIPVAGETFREFVKHLYQQNRLVMGEMTLREMPVKLQNIACPLLTLTAKHDHLVPPDSTLAIKHYISSQFVNHLSVNAGHIGLAVSSKAHSSLWPDAAMWIADHSTNQR